MDVLLASEPGVQRGPCAPSVRGTDPFGTADRGLPWPGVPASYIALVATKEGSTPGTPGAIPGPGPTKNWDRVLY
jgi:hypothetical protein